MDNPWKLLVISDSSFKGEDQKALAMKSGIIALGNKNGPIVGNNPLQVLEFVSKKQSRVCRSTFTAELYAALDLIGLANNINLALSEILEGKKTARDLADLQENGVNVLQTDLVIDTQSVFTSVAAADTKTTTDPLMLIHALKLKEILSLRIANRLLWADTRDLLADGLNKGTVDRNALRLLCFAGKWVINHQMKTQPESNGTCSLRHLLTEVTGKLTGYLFTRKLPGYLAPSAAWLKRAQQFKMP